MGAFLLAGVTHYPPLCGTDDAMAGIHRHLMRDPAVPPDVVDPANWPAAQRVEWGDDEGRASAPAHRVALREGFSRVRAAIDEFEPDVVLVWGDDQYENFTERIIPPYALLAYGDLEAHPWTNRPVENVWGEPVDFTYPVRGAPEIGRWLATSLLEDGIDVAYSYTPNQHPDLAHAFLNALLFLDYDRVGFPWPVLAMPLNCYGRRVISARGAWKPFGTDLTPDPPSPAPRRFMEVGAAVARAFRGSDKRVVLLASSSWSHAFLVDHNWRMRPDTEADRVLYDALTSAEFESWADYPLDAIERAGQQEVLNWFCLAGAARELGAGAPEWHTFVETQVFNSNKVFALWANQ